MPIGKKLINSPNKCAISLPSSFSPPFDSPLSSTRRAMNELERLLIMTTFFLFYEFQNVKKKD
jgi:hypothetical protein